MTRAVFPKTSSRVIAVAIASCFAGGAHALPVAPSVVNGAASFAQSGNVLTVTNSNGAIINWQTFNIGAGETTRFIQPSASSQVMNRVLANDPSLIYGNLSSNGKVWLVNPAGILVGPSGSINTAGFVASTLPVRNEDFLANKLTFGNSSTLGTGTVVNQGTITTPEGGSVYLIGAASVENQGLIQTPKGETVLAAGQTVQLLDTGTPGVKVEITGNGNSTNLGQIVADAGRIGLVGSVVKNRGTLNASSVVNEGGRIFLRASQDAYVDGDGRIVTTGSKGGQVEVLGNRVAVMDNAAIDASGTTGGGTILVGGDAHGANPDIPNSQISYFGPNASLKANATDNGNGGKVVVWSDDTTRAYGRIEAKGGASGGNGGFVETSGKRYLDAKGAIVRAASWLLDPADITISHSATAGTIQATPFAPAGATATITDADINATLDAGTSLAIQTSSGTGSNNGTITINGTADSGGAVSILNSTGGAQTLTLIADKDIAVNGGASLSGSAGNALGVSMTASGSIAFASGSTITSYGGAVSMTAGSIGLSAASSATKVVNTAPSAATANSGAITLHATSGDITVGGGLSTAKAASGQTVVGSTGAISLTALGNVTVAGDVDTSNYDDGSQKTVGGTGAITATAQNGALSLGNLYSYVITYQTPTTTGDAGAVTLSAGTSVNTGSIVTRTFDNDGASSHVGRAGDVRVAAGANITTSGIDASSETGTYYYGPDANSTGGGGNVTLTSTTGDIATGIIKMHSAIHTGVGTVGANGNLAAYAYGGGISVGDVYSASPAFGGTAPSGGNVTLYANGSVTAGNINVTSLDSAAGNVEITSLTNNVVAPNVLGGDMTVTASGGQISQGTHSVQVSHLTLSAAAGIDFSNASNSFGTLTASNRSANCTTIGACDISIVNGNTNGFVVAGISNPNSLGTVMLTAANNSAVTQVTGASGALNIAGTLDLEGAGASLTLNNPANSVAGLMVGMANGGISPTGGVTYVGTGALTLAGIKTSGGDFSVAIDGALTQLPNTTISTSGNSSAANGGNVSLTAQSISLTGALQATGYGGGNGGDVAVRAVDGGITLSDINAYSDSAFGAGGGHGGNVIITVGGSPAINSGAEEHTSALHAIQVGAINVFGSTGWNADGGHGGSVTVSTEYASAGGSVIVGNVTVSGGNVALSEVGRLQASMRGGDAGSISLFAKNGDLRVLSASGNGGTSGNGEFSQGGAGGLVTINVQGTGTVNVGSVAVNGGTSGGFPATPTALGGAGGQLELGINTTGDVTFSSISAVGGDSQFSAGAGGTIVANIAGGVVQFGSISANGGRGTNGYGYGHGVGGNGGSITVAGHANASGGLTFGSLSAYGGDGGSGYAIGNPGRAGGAGGLVSVANYGGGLTINGNGDVHGGIGGNAYGLGSTKGDGGAGGSGGSFSATAVNGALVVNGFVNASGGTGAAGVSGYGASPVPGAGGAGGAGGLLNLSGASITAQSLLALGGGGGAGGWGYGQPGASGGQGGAGGRIEAHSSGDTRLWSASALGGAGGLNGGDTSAANNAQTPAQAGAPGAVLFDFTGTGSHLLTMASRNIDATSGGDNLVIQANGNLSIAAGESFAPFDMDGNITAAGDIAIEGVGSGLTITNAAHIAGSAVSVTANALTMAGAVTATGGSVIYQADSFTGGGTTTAALAQILPISSSKGMTLDANTGVQKATSGVLTLVPSDFSGFGVSRLVVGDATSAGPMTVVDSSGGAAPVPFDLSSATGIGQLLLQTGSGGSIVASTGLTTSSQTGLLINAPGGVTIQANSPIAAKYVAVASGGAISATSSITASGAATDAEAAALTGGYFVGGVGIGLHASGNIAVAGLSAPLGAIAVQAGGSFSASDSLNAGGTTAVSNFGSGNLGGVSLGISAGGDVTLGAVGAGSGRVLIDTQGVFVLNGALTTTSDSHTFDNTGAQLGDTAVGIRAADVTINGAISVGDGGDISLKAMNNKAVYLGNATGQFANGQFNGVPGFVLDNTELAKLHVAPASATSSHDGSRIFVGSDSAVLLDGAIFRNGAVDPSVTSPLQRVYLQGTTIDSVGTAVGLKAAGASLHATAGAIGGASNGGNGLTVNVSALSASATTNVTVLDTPAGTSPITGPLALRQLASSNGGALSLTTDRSLVIEPYYAGQQISTTGTVNLTAGGSITAAHLNDAGVRATTNNPYQAAAGGLISAGTLNLSAGSGINLTNANAVGTLNATNTVSGDINVSNSGNLIVGSISDAAGAVKLQANGAVTIGTAGSISSAASGDAIVVAGSGFSNQASAGASALSTPNGRWLIYADSPVSAAAKNGLTSSFRHYNATYANYASPTESGNGFIYASAPGTLIVDVTAASNVGHIYGDAPTANFTYILSGFADNEDNAGTIGLGGNFVSNMSSATHAGSHTAIYSSGLTDTAGYNFAAGNGVAYTVSPRTLTVSLNDSGVSKTFDGTAAANLTPTYGVSGLMNGDSATFTATSVAYNDAHVANASYLIANGVSLNSIAGSGLLSDYVLSGNTAASAAHSASIAPLPSLAWSGGGTNNLWSNAANWGGMAWTSGDVLAVTLPSSATVRYDASAGSTSLNAITSAGSFILSGGILSVAGSFTTPSYTQSGGVLTGAGSLSVSNLASMTGGSINLGGDVLLTNSGAMTVGNISANSITLHSGGALSQLGGTGMSAGMSTGSTGVATAASTGATVTTGTAATTLSTTPGSGLLSVQSVGGAVLNGANHVSAFSATNTGSGNVELTSTGVLDVRGISNSAGNVTVVDTGGLSTTGLVQASGRVSLTTHSPLTIGSAGLIAGGAIDLTAGTVGSLSSTDNLTLNGSVTSSGGSTIALYAGNNFTMASNSVVSSSGGAISAAVYGDMVLAQLNAGSGGSVDLFGAGKVSSAPGTSGSNIVAGTLTGTVTGAANFSTFVKQIDMDLGPGSAIAASYMAPPAPTPVNDAVNSVTSAAQQSASSTSDKPATMTVVLAAVPASATGAGNNSALLNQTVGGTSGTFGSSEPAPTAASSSASPSSGSSSSNGSSASNGANSSASSSDSSSSSSGSSNGSSSSNGDSKDAKDAKDSKDTKEASSKDSKSSKDNSAKKPAACS